MSDWTDAPSTHLVDRLTPVPLAERGAIKAGPADKATHDSHFDALPLFRQVEIGGAPPRRDAIEQSARVVFWNTERLRHLDAIADSLAALRPDVMLLCEIDRGMARSGNTDRVVEIATSLDAGYAYSVEFLELDLGDIHEKRIHAGETNADGLHGAAILTDVAMARPFVIRIDRRGDWFDGARHEPRVGGTIAVGAEIIVAGVPVLMVNVHLESHDNPVARGEDMRRLLTQIDLLAPGGAVILGGDFNTSTFALRDRPIDADRWAEIFAADPHRMLRPQSYEPLFKIAASFGYDTAGCNVPDRPTTRRPLGDPRPLAKIDWFFTRGLAVTDPQIIAAVRDTGEPSSDHEGLLVTVAPLGRV